MKPISKLARELASEPGPYSIKVKVIDKKYVRSSLENNKALDYQTLTFEDEEGAKLHSILFHDSLPDSEDNIEDAMEYEITNAKVELIRDVDTENTDDQMYRRKFNINTIVDCLPIQPKYISIAEIPRTVSLGDRYDVLGIVIYVDPKCQITRPNGQLRDICEVIIVDQSSEQIMIATAWEEQAIEECQRIQDIPAPFPVIGFTA